VIVSVDEFLWFCGPAQAQIGVRDAVAGSPLAESAFAESVFVKSAMPSDDRETAGGTRRNWQ